MQEKAEIESRLGNLSMFAVNRRKSRRRGCDVHFGASGQLWLGFIAFLPQKTWCDEISSPFFPNMYVYMWNA
jgi:hypothetical protein